MSTFKTIAYEFDELAELDDKLYSLVKQYNAQAILGNGLTYSQAELLKQYKFSKVILAFDNDKGGETAVKIAKKRLGDGYKYLQVTYPEGCKDVQEMTAEQIKEMFSNCTGKRKLRRI